MFKYIKHWHITTIRFIVALILSELAILGILLFSLLVGAYYDMTGISAYLMR